MRFIRFLSSILQYVSLVAATGYGLSGIYSLFLFVFSSIFSDASWLAIEFYGNRFQINFPFTETAFLIGENTTGYKNTMAGTLLLYGLFFFLLAKVFFVFRQKKLFTREGVSNLKLFSRANLFIPIVAVIIFSTISHTVEEEFILVVLHAIIGIFALFLEAIFRQGHKLQNDQDLTI